MKTSQGLVIDGFMRSSSGNSGQDRKIQKITEASNLLNPKTASTKIKSAAQGVHNKAQRSQTLMRSAVKRPASFAKVPAAAPKQPQVTARSKQVDEGRLNRINTVNKNTKVRRFGHGVNANSVKSPTRKVEEGEVISRAQATQPAQHASTELSKPLPSLVTSASHHQLERLLDEALTRADAHKKTRRGHAGSTNIAQRLIHAPRWMTVTAVVCLVALVAGVFAVNKIPQVAVKVAAARANINAQVPAYTPAGFSFVGPVSYSDGNVSITYKSNDGSNRQFTIKQSSSSMSSKSLEDKVVPKNTQVQTSVVNGTTVYIYGEKNDAAWVNRGIQYTVADNANLNSDQLLKIANSL